MNKENLVVTMLAVYAILFTLCLAIYAFIDIFNIDKSLASNLLVWSATIFAPIALLITYDSWRGQKASEVIALEASKTFKLLSSIELTSCTCFKYMHEIDEDSKKFIENILNEYNVQYEQIFNSLQLITYVVNDEYLEKCFNDFANTNFNFSSVIRFKISGESEVENINVLEKNIEDIMFVKLYYIDQLKVILSEYALYIRKFKKFSK